MPSAYLFLFDGFADWEPASAVAELRRTFGCTVKTFGRGTHPIVSMGGLTVTPDLSLSEVPWELVDLLILPGGDAWTNGEVAEITGVIRAVHQAGRPVAAICAATLALAHAGLLDDHRHTSNGDGFISYYVPAYRGHRLYAKVPAMTDRNVITASGLASSAFAAEIFRALAPERAGDIAMYEALHAPDGWSRPL
jgi:putative intracellular protease/amidase